MDLFASLFFSPGPAPGFFFLAPGWRYTCGGHGWPRVVCACSDGATHAEAMDGRESCAHAEMALHMRRPWMAESRVRMQRWRYTCGGHGWPRVVCACRDGATHAEAMDGRESCCTYRD